MGEILDLYEPTNTLKPVADDIWIVDGPIVRMAVGPGSMPFPTRMTIVRLANGDLFVHSPTEFDDGLSAEIDGLGKVAHLVSPNRIHYAHIPTWKEHYPDATAWASPGVRERAASQKIEVDFDRDLGDEPEQAWADELDQLRFRGSRVMDEIVFFHRASRTMILADLIENFELPKVPKKYHLLMRLAGITDPDGRTPADYRLTFLGNKDQASECARKLIAMEPQRIIIAHGRWYDTDAVAELRRAFRWLDI